MTPQPTDTQATGPKLGFFTRLLEDAPATGGDVPEPADAEAAAEGEPVQTAEGQTEQDFFVLGELFY